MNWLMFFFRTVSWLGMNYRLTLVNARNSIG